MDILARWWSGRWWALPLVVLIVSGTGFVVVYTVGVLTIRGQMVEKRALDASTFRGEPDGLLSFVSIGTIALSLAVLVAIGLFSRRYRAVGRVTVVVVIANALAQVLKYEVLSRPAYLDDPSANTLPSGHAVAYASVLLGLIMVVPVALRTIAAVAASGVLGVVVVQLLAFGWHRPSDVVAGILLVTGVAALAQLVLSDRRQPHVPRPRRPAPRALVGASLLLVLALVAVALLFAVDGSLPTTQLLLLSSEALCVGVVSVAAVTTVLLQRSTRGVAAPSPVLEDVRG